MKHQKLIDFLNSLLPSTSSVDLSHKLIGDAGAKVLAKATHLSQLQTLDLGWNQIGDEGAKALLH